MLRWSARVLDGRCSDPLTNALLRMSNGNSYHGFLGGIRNKDPASVNLDLMYHSIALPLPLYYIKAT